MKYTVSAFVALAMLGGTAFAASCPTGYICKTGTVVPNVGSGPKCLHFSIMDASGITPFAVSYNLATASTVGELAAINIYTKVVAHEGKSLYVVSNGVSLAECGNELNATSVGDP